MLNFARLAAVTDKILTVVGALTLTQQRLVSGSYSTVGTGKGIFTRASAAPATAPRSAGLAETAVTTRSLLLSSTFTDIRVSDRLVNGAEVYTIVAVDRIQPTDVNCAWKVEVK